MAQAGETDLEKMTLVQLKGEAARKGLDQSGRKEDLITRLQEAMVKTEVKEAPMEEQKPSEQPPKAKLAYDAANALRMVIINPFKFEMASNAGLQKWIKESSSTVVKKSRNGTTAAVLYFRTIEKGEQGYSDLKTKLKKYDVNITHQTIHQKRRIGQDFNEDEFEELTRDQPDEPIVPRWLVLENLTEEQNTEENLLELFPEAYNVYSCQCIENGKGIAVLEFFSEEELEEFHKNSGKEMELDGAKIKITKYTSRMAEWARLKERIKRDPNREYTGEKLERKALTDEDRIEINNQWRELSVEQDEIQNNPDMYGMEKITRYYEIGSTMRAKNSQLAFDTRRRMREAGKDEVKLPEPEDEMLPYTKTIINGDNHEELLKEYNRQLKWANYKVDQLKGFIKKLDGTTKAEKEKYFQERARGGRQGQRGRGGHMNRGGRGGQGGGFMGNRQGFGGRGGFQSRGRDGGPVKRGYYDYNDQPPMKRQQMSGGNWQDGGGFMQDGSTELIHGLASAITNKMNLMAQMQSGGGQMQGGGFNRGQGGNFGGRGGNFSGRGGNFGGRGRGMGMRGNMSRGFNQRF